MNGETSSKVADRHLKRNAYLYVRQSSLRQVIEHTESTKRQYALRQRAVALGWAGEQIIVIDKDLGQSGASAQDRAGFQQLMTELSMGRVGIVLGLEVSRLARNSTDWHRLLEIAALTDTLILDEDGIYDPAHFNDRLLLGLKGTMSEAELHVMRARLRGGLLNKARRGELVVRLPIGLVRDGEDRVVLDPDQQVQQTIRLFFETFRRVGSASGVVGHFQKQKILFPRGRSGGLDGEVYWGKLELRQALRMLRNPRFAGAFFFGRTRCRKTVDGESRTRLARQDWIALQPGAHAGYIDWDEYEQNQRQLQANGQAFGADRRGPAREGPALLQGMILCGVCGARMTVHYHVYGSRRAVEYCCQQRLAIRNAEPSCRAIHGAILDAAIGDLLIETMTPVALEMALQVEQQLQTRIDEADRLRRAQVDRARYEADLARRRYMRVDPDNRLVADSLEADWNQKLRTLNEAEQDYQWQREADQRIASAETRSKILALATDFPTLWRDTQTPDRERKRMLRLLIEDVTVIKTDQLTVHVRFKAGPSKTLMLPVKSFAARQTSAEVIAEIDRLLNSANYQEIADSLNQRGFRTGFGHAFHSAIISRICTTRGLKNRYDRLRAKGMLTLQEIANQLRVGPDTVRKWARHGLLRAHAYTDHNDCVYEPPNPNLHPKSKGVKLRKRLALLKNVDTIAQAVQYET
jgi:DNA invertase Pin-like site-specific DNA recombinase